MPRGRPLNPDREQVKRNNDKSKKLWQHKNHLCSEYRGMTICPKCGERGASIYKYYKTKKFGVRLSKAIRHTKEIKGPYNREHKRKYKNKICHVMTITVDRAPYRFNLPVVGKVVNEK